MDKSQTKIKYTDEMAKELFEALGAKAATDAVNGLDELAEKNGTFEVCISTEDVDRHGEIVKQDGLNVDNFMKNPVVLFGHNHWALPIAVCTDIEKRDGKTYAKGIFASHTQAQAQRELHDMGISATSIGFIEKERDGNIIVESELIEFSFVPVPANPYVHAIREAGLDVAELASKGLLTTNIKEGDVVENYDDDTTDTTPESDTIDDETAIEGDDIENKDDETPDAEETDIENDSDDETGDEPESDTAKILSVLSGIDKRLSALENSKNGSSADVAGSESEGGETDDADDEGEDASDDDVTPEESDKAVKFLRNRRKAQKAVKLLNELLTDWGEDAKKHY